MNDTTTTTTNAETGDRIRAGHWYYIMKGIGGSESRYIAAVAIADLMEPHHRGARICRREITRVILPHETKTQHNTPPSVVK